MLKTSHLIGIVMIGGLSVLVSSYLVYYFKVMSSKPELRHIPNGKFASFIAQKCPTINETFYPSWWCGSTLMQTLVPVAFRSQLPDLRYTRETLNCPDGGIVSLDWFEGAPSSEVTMSGGPKPSPVAVMFPGLIGDSQSDYLRNIVPSLQRLGYRVVSFNNRGRGGMELKTPRLYSAANFDDIELALDTIRENNPTSRLVATGFSMGGMCLTRYLAERGDQVKVDAAMLVSANYDLVNGSKAMEHGLINRYVAKTMTKAIADILISEKEVLKRAEKPVQWDKLSQAKTLRELDLYFTCPMWGYKTVEEYFEDSTNIDRIPKIKVPTLALNSADDLFSPYDTLPLDKVNEATVFVVTQRGGHLGFMDGWVPSVPYYGDRLIEEYHKAILEIESIKELVKPTQQSD